jgi:hypothetical protein
MIVSKECRRVFCGLVEECGGVELPGSRKEERRRSRLERQWTRTSHRLLALPLAPDGNSWCHPLMRRVMFFGAASLLLVAQRADSTDEELPARVVSLHYPCVALKARIQGAVRLQCTIGEDGFCSDVKPIAGHPLLLRDAIDNLKKWRYSPSRSRALRPRSALVQYRFLIGPPKAKYEPDVAVTFDGPNILTVVAPSDDDIACQYKLDEAPLGPRHL